MGRNNGHRWDVVVFFGVGLLLGWMSFGYLDEYLFDSADLRNVLDSKGQTFLFTGVYCGLVGLMFALVAYMALFVQRFDESTLFRTTRPILLVLGLATMVAAGIVLGRIQAFQAPGGTEAGLMTLCVPLLVMIATAIAAVVATGFILRRAVDRRRATHAVGDSRGEISVSTEAENKGRPALDKADLVVRLDPPEWWKKPSVVEIVCLIAGEFFVFWYGWIMDDAYVYFRYADNLVIHGNGFVWNAGEYVEGFSSPFWALLLVLLRLLRANYWIIVRVVGALSYALFWWLACVVNRGLVVSERKEGAAFNIPLVYLTFTYGVLCYFTSGLESPLVLVMGATFAAAILWPESIPLQIAVGLAPMIRHELFIPYGIFVVYAATETRRPPMAAILSCLLSLGGYVVFRIWYYADVFPNTFYLKDETWTYQGLRYVYDSLLPYQTVPYLLGAVALLWALSRYNRQSPLLRRKRLVMVLAALPVACYVVKIGGDPRHFRYLAFPFALVVLSTGGLVETAAQSLGRPAWRYGTVLVLAFGAAVGMNYPRQLWQHPIFLNHFGFGHRMYLLINDSAVYRLSYATARGPFDTGEDLSWASAVERSQGEEDGGKTLVTSWCREGYVHAGGQVIHSLGLTEPFLGRTRMRSDRPAHKLGLKPLAADIAPVRDEYGFRKRAFDDALEESPETPEWIGLNIEKIRMIEKKVYNNHRFFENLSLALTRIGQLEPRAEEAKKAVAGGSKWEGKKKG